MFITLSPRLRIEKNWFFISFSDLSVKDRVPALDDSRYLGPFVP